jgi:hypothetical protein
MYFYWVFLRPLAKSFANWMKYEDLRTMYRYALYNKKINDSGIEIDKKIFDEKRKKKGDHFKKDTAFVGGEE